jgi:hypothetical protein
MAIWYSSREELQWQGLQYTLIQIGLSYLASRAKVAPAPDCDLFPNFLCALGPSFDESSIPRHEKGLQSQP